MGKILDNPDLRGVFTSNGIGVSHIVKFVRLGSTITTTALSGLVVGDLVIRVIAADGTVTAKLCTTADTLPDDPADLDYLIVLGATAL